MADADNPTTLAEHLAEFQQLSPALPSPCDRLCVPYFYAGAMAALAALGNRIRAGDDFERAAIDLHDEVRSTAATGAALARAKRNARNG